VAISTVHSRLAGPCVPTLGLAMRQQPSAVQLGPPAVRRPASRSRLIEIVATPGSGNGRATRTAVQIRDALRASGHEVRLDVFPDLGRLRRWAGAGNGGLALLICVGGDATQSAAAAAAFRGSVPFLPVPAGFGNLFARAFGHTHEIERVIGLVARGRVVDADVGFRNGQPFLCEESFGPVADLQERVEAGLAHPRARWRRWAAYYRAVLRQFRDTPLTALEVTVDGEVVADDAVLVTVANVKTYGPWLPLTPAASPVDGLFDVFVMRRATRLEVLAKLLRRQLRLPGVEQGTLLHRGRRVCVARSRSARDELVLIPALLPVVVSPPTAAALEREVISTHGGSTTGRRLA
jgi:diacylglycerol kinase (ATP)